MVGGVLTICWLETWLILIGVIWANGPYEGGINAGHPGRGWDREIEKLIGW